jgi:hypothetical protein
MIEQEVWTTLERAAPGPTGWAKTRVHPRSSQDLWAAVKHPQMYRTLVYVIDARDAPLSKELPQLRHLAVEMTSHDEDRVELHTRLEDSSLGDVFSVLAGDIAHRISEASNAAEGVSALIARLQHWRSLLQPEDGQGLSLERRRGLFGELFVLRSLLIAGVSPTDLVNGWVGPTGANQDLQMPIAAIEVKTTSAKKPQSIQISSERQLDGTGIDSLFLAHVCLDERNAGEGESLPELVHDLEKRLGGALLSAFRQTLYASGLLPTAMAHYEEPKYTLRSQEYFEVSGDFPRIVEDMCPTGLGDVRYSIQLGALKDYSIDQSSVALRIGVTQ